MKELRTLGLLKLIELFNCIPEFDYNSFIKEIFAAAVSPKVSVYSTKCVQWDFQLQKVPL